MMVTSIMTSPSEFSHRRSSSRPVRASFPRSAGRGSAVLPSPSAVYGGRMSGAGSSGLRDRYVPPVLPAAAAAGGGGGGGAAGAGT